MTATLNSPCANQCWNGRCLHDQRTAAAGQIPSALNSLRTAVCRTVRMVVREAGAARPRLPSAIWMANCKTALDIGRNLEHDGFPARGSQVWLSTDKCSSQRWLHRCASPFPDAVSKVNR